MSPFEPPPFGGPPLSPLSRHPLSGPRPTFRAPFAPFSPKLAQAVLAWTVWPNRLVSILTSPSPQEVPGSEGPSTEGARSPAPRQCHDCPCLCESVARRATPPHQQGLCPPLGFQRAFQLNIAGLRRAIFWGLGFRVSGRKRWGPKIKNTFVESWARLKNPKTEDRSLLGSAWVGGQEGQSLVQLTRYEPQSGFA